MKLDLYWSPTICAATNRGSVAKSFVRSYIGKTNVNSCLGKTYDNTIEEEQQALKDPSSAFEESEAERKANRITKTIVSFWGDGFTPDYYKELEARYKSWTSSLGELDPAERAIYRQICMLEVRISRDSAAGKPIDKHVNSLNALLGSAKLKPAQKSDGDIALDNMPFGVGIKKWENTRPVPEPDPEFQDVDGIVRYVSTWFLGHLCKMVGIKNAYSKLYEEAIENLRVTNPEFEDEDDEALFDDVFS